MDDEAGLYATGWIKRGPVGLIGHTKSDALETITNLVADAEAGLLSATDGPDVLDLLDAHERHLGETHEHTRERVKVVPREEQVAVSRDGALVP